MSLQVKLSELVDEMDVGEEMTIYLNKKTGKFIMLDEESLSLAENEEDAESFDDLPDWQQDSVEETQDFLKHQDDYLGLPTKFDIDEYEIMRDFCQSIVDAKQSAQLLRAIHGSGAFRRFKSLASEFGIIEQWYSHRARAFKNIAVEWCEVHHVNFIDDITIS